MIQTEAGTRITARQRRKWVVLKWIIPTLIFIFLIPFTSITLTAIAGHAGWIDSSRIPSVSRNGGPSRPMTLSDIKMISMILVVFYGFGLCLAAKTLITTFCPTTILIGGGKATVREGISTLASKSAIDIASIRSIKILKHPSASSDDDVSVCIDTSNGSVRLGRHLDRDQQEWLATQLAHHLPEKAT